MRLWRLLPLLALAACAETGPCRLRQAAELPATLVDGRLEVSGRVNGAPTQLLLDTGAERTVLTAATVAALQLPRSQRSSTRLTGVGGAVSNADVFASLDLGGVAVDRRLAVADIPGLAGLVGTDVLAGYDLELDVPGQRVRLWRAPGCGMADLPWTGPRIAVPVSLTGAGRIELAVAVDGAPVKALLDSGAGRSVMTDDAARRLGVTTTALASDRAGLVRGVDGGAIGLRLHRFTSLAVGGDAVARPWLGVAPLQLGGAEMLLGIDYLRVRRVWVSFRTKQMFVQAAGADG